MSRFPLLWLVCLFGAGFFSYLAFYILLYFNLFELILLDGKRSHFVLFKMNIQFIQHFFLLYRLLFSPYNLFAVSSKIIWLHKYSFSSGASILFHWFVTPHATPTMHWFKELHIFTLSLENVCQCFSLLTHVCFSQKPF